ncbi:MAG: molybdenum cofactor biosynthesis protein MoaE [Nocardioidaceae bacterium]
MGDVAVVCAASATHRETTFAATRSLIDRLKQQVPIWKEQGYCAGERSWIISAP